MGSYSPPEFYTHAFGSKIMQTIMAPTIKAMREEGYPYTGVLYGGLMMTENGPKIIEFNARLGDPETQVVLPRLESDLLEVMQAVIYHNLAGVNISWIKEACVGVVLASGGYPGSYTTGFPISGLNDVDTDVMVFHAGTRMESGEVVTNGGRVLTVVATGPTLAEARLKVYNNVSRIAFKGMHYRKDIALVP
jgi:phosphoribosylamine--glycine ligase